MAEEIQTYNPKDFAQVLQIIEQRRSQAVQAVNHASLLVAWEVGAFVSDRIKNAAWGAKVVQQLAEYIHTQNPTLKGWSRANIYKMVQFYESYTSPAFIELIKQLKLNKQLMPALSAQIEDAGIVPFETAQTNGTQIVSFEMRQMKSRQIVSFEMRQIPSLLLKTGWTNHQIILNRCSAPEQYIFYILYAEYEHLQNKELERAIKTDAYSRTLIRKLCVMPSIAV